MSELDGMLDSLARLARAPRELAERAAREVEDALRATAAAGTDPYGRPWKPTLEGKRAMVRAGDHLRATLSGKRIRVTLTGPDVYHHFGTRGEPRRAILPDAGITPPSIATALDRAATEVFERSTR